MHVELPEKLYYSIGEVADAFGVNASLIRFWEKEFDVIKPKKNAKGNRKFTPEDIKNLELARMIVLTGDEKLRTRLQKSWERKSRHWEKGARARALERK